METTENKKKVLLVEDDIFVSDIYQMKLHTEGVEALVAMNGQEAIQHLESGAVPDLILLDIIMPVLDGLDVLRKIKANDAWKNIPVVMLTNLSDKRQVDECMTLGANDYIVKSHYTPSEVMEKVYSFLKA
jgi:CheY-like chemotaxis protein